MESMRRLNFGHHKHAEFAAHVHILDLHNVPLVEGECRLKWRFQNGMNLNTTNNEKVMGQALQTSVSYLKELRNAAAGNTSDDRGGAGDYGEDGSSPNGDGDHSLGGRFKDAISHASRTLRASTLSHGSGDQTSPRSRSLSMPRSGNGHPNPTSPTTERDYPIWKTTAPTDYFRQGGEGSHDVDGKPIKPSASHGFFGGNTSASPPNSPKAFANNILSPTTTVRPSGTPRQPTALLSPTTPPARPRQSTTANHTSSYNTSTNLSRKNTAVPSADGVTGHPVSRSPTSLVDSLHHANMPIKAEIKGKTAYMPLIENQVRFDKHIVCAVAIPLQKNSKHLEASTVKLKVLHKVRTTPLPGSIGSRPAPAAIHEDGTASPASQAIRNHKTRINGSSVSLSSPGHSGLSTLHINTKEAHEEISLGEVAINLSEFVSVDYTSGRAGVGQTKETWTTRRYLLQDGKTNALLRVAVKMDWISGVRDFTAPPLMKGQIISPKKQVVRGNNAKNRDKDKEKASLHSGASSNSSRMYIHGDNASSRSIISTEQTDLRRPLSLRNPLYGRKANSRASPDDTSDVGSIAGMGNRHHLHYHGPLHHHHHTGGGFEYGLDDEHTDIDIINAIFSKPETPPASPQPTPDRERKASFDNDDHRLQRTVGHQIPLHSDGNLSEASHKSHHQSPAQALAFFHRSRDKAGKGKQASTGQLSIDEVGGKVRKRLSSAPSKSIFPPLRSNSRASTAASIAVEQGLAGRLDAHDPHRHEYHLSNLHEEFLGPVLVHIPTTQAPIDVHSHPFRWKGKSTPTLLQNLSHGSHTSNAPHDGENDSGYAVDGTLNHGTSIAIASRETVQEEAGKRRATTSAAVGIFKMPFKNRSSSVLSGARSLQSVTAATETASPQTILTASLDDLSSEHASKKSADINRGSLDLQKTLRPSSEGDPTRTTLRRMTSPASMTPAEEADLQLYIREHLAGGQEGKPTDTPLAKKAQDVRTSDEPSRFMQPLGGRREAERRHSVSHLQHEIKTRSRQNSQGSSYSSTEASSTSAVERDELVRQATNEEALNDRARRLRERGLLPTLSITTSDDVPARSPTGRA